MNSEDSNDQRHWRSETDREGIVWLCIDKADGSVNVLSRPVLEQLAEILQPMADDPPRGLVIYSGKSNGFVMGADINEFTKIENAEQGYELVRLGQQVLDLVADLRCPTVTVINGHALGGGLELAMACDYRLAFKSDEPIIGLPEVKLGIHPGFGGTVRSVRIAGVRTAMELMLTGKSITASRALRQGLVDRLVADDHWKPAARELLAARRPPARAPLADRLLNLAPLRPILARVLEKQVSGKARRDHYPAPYAIIELWKKHGASETKGYDAEARSIAELMCGSTSRNLVRVFFLQNRLKDQASKSAPAVRRLHVVGAGTMGGDIAAWCALRGLTVTLEDREEKYIRPALERAGKLFAKKIRNDEDREAAHARLRSDVDGEGAADADLVIEAIFENLEAKKKLYARLDGQMKKGCVLATNTSSIPLEDLRRDLAAPGRFIGLHFFNPVAQLPLVEVVRTDDTDQEALDIGLGFVKAIGKSPLGCRSAPGFVVNRVLMPYMSEAMFLAKEGVSLPAIDRAAEHFGMPMGPVELADSVGLDVALEVSKVLGKAFGRPVPEDLEELVEAGRLGRKSGRGYYEWVDGKAKKPGDGDGRRPEDMTDRLMLPMVNEAVACLSEDVVEEADLLDAGVIFGTGFAPFRGGPLNYARERGIDDIVAALEKLAEEHGERFRPHPGWRDIRDRLEKGA